MAVYGVPSTQNGYVTSYYASAVKGGSSLAVTISLLLNPEPDTELLNFQTTHTQGLTTEGSNYIRHEAYPPMSFSGPFILKIQAIASGNNVDVSAGFDLYIEDK